MNFLSDYFSVNQTLEHSLQSTYKLLSSFATAEDFTIKMKMAFGDRIHAEVANQLAADWARGDFTALPKIEIHPSQEINGAVGAYAQATNTVFISREYLFANSEHVEAIARVLLEEIGHFVDAQMNEIDALGDEGA